VFSDGIPISHGHRYPEDLLIGSLDTLEVEGLQMPILGFLDGCVAADVGATVLLGRLDALLRPKFLQIGLISILLARFIKPRTKSALLPGLVLLGLGIGISLLGLALGEVV
jgi:hypothetical protein